MYNWAIFNLILILKATVCGISVLLTCMPEVKMAGYWPSSFVCFWQYHKQHCPKLTHFVSPFKKFFLTWIQEGTLKQASAHLPHLDSQLEQRIKFRMEQINVTIINPLRIIISYNIDPSPYTIHYHSTLLLTNSPLLSTGSRYVSWLSCSLKSVAFSLGLSILMSSWGFSYTGLLTRIKHLIKVLTNYKFIDKTY